MKLFRSQTPTDSNVRIGRYFVDPPELQRIEGDLLRLVRTAPSADAYYELAKIASLRNDAPAAQERLRASIELDPQFFEPGTKHSYSGKQNNNNRPPLGSK